VPEKDTTRGKAMATSAFVGASRSPAKCLTAPVPLPRAEKPALPRICLTTGGEARYAAGMRWASIDPGLRHCGVSVWEDKTLVEATLVLGDAQGTTAKTWRAMAWAVGKYLLGKGLDQEFSKVFIEFPQIYDRARAKGDPNDLLHLAAVVGAVISHWKHCEYVLPRAWKGQVPKSVTKSRCLARLSEKEKIQIHGITHDVWDAVGIGLYFREKT
jgi:hypothetical protein